MDYFNKNPQHFRLVFGAFLIVLLFVSGMSFYRFGSFSTDENLFTTPPSPLYVTQAFPATVNGQPGTHVDSVLVGDLILSVNNTKVRDAGQVLSELSQVPMDRMLSLGIHRSGENRSYEVSVLRGDIPDDFYVTLPSSAYVIHVAKGGASDRAGMEVGDLIYRINGQSFSTVFGADRILRSGGVGKTITYDVLRNNQHIALHVTLASFGLRFGTVVMVLSGLVFAGLGAFIGLARPRIRAARLLGLRLAVLGFAIVLALIRRELEISAESLPPMIAGFGAIFFSFPLHLHSAGYFPKERPSLIARKWILPTGYVLASVFTVAVVATVPTPAVPFYIGLAVMILYTVLIFIGFRKESTPEYRKLNRPLRWTGVVTVVCTLIFVVILVKISMQALTANIGYVGAILLMIPVSHIYVIGRYHLLDLDLRIRRSIQYNVVALVWRLGITVLFVWLMLQISEWKPELPGIRTSSSSIELLDAPMATERQEFFRTIILLVSAIGLAFLFWKLGHLGLEFLAKRFHRARYDYRRAAQELGEVMSTTLDMNTLARGIAVKLATLMHLKRVGVLFFRNEKACCCQEAFGFDGSEWSSFCVTNDHGLAEAIMQFHGEFRVDYLPEPIKSTFHVNQFQYLIPIRSKDTLVGTLLVGEKLSESTFAQEDLEFLRTAARQASVAIMNAFLYEEVAEQERMKHELSIARRIQMESLPQHTPAVHGLDIAGTSIPAWEVGGDYFDYLNGTEGSMTVIVGDVSGKGTSAALYLSKVQGILRSLHGFGLSPRDLFIRANQLLWSDLEKKSFITALGGSFCPETGTVTIARAGHLPLFVFRTGTQHTERITPRGIGIGLSNNDLFAAEIEEQTLRFSPGDVFAFVSDGITEGTGEGNEEFGERRLCEVLRGASAGSAGEIRDAIFNAVRSFTQNGTPHDDQTVVVVKIEASSASDPN